MPNRIIKESICTSDQIDGLSPMEEICFYRLIVNCDDYGRCDARPSILRAKLFPLKTVSNAEMEQMLDALERVGLVARYSVEGREYLFLPGWNRNQRVRNQRSKYPAPAGWKEQDDDGQQPDDGCQQSAVNCQQPAVNCQQVAADCGYNPIQSQSVSQSVSQSQSEYEGQSVSGKKEENKIYNDNWRYSPRARLATAQILVDAFHRACLPCAEIRDLFVVVQRALEQGVPPDEITLAAHRMGASEFAAHFMASG
ncbi:MAG: hypothetical protein IKM02_02300 [Clostridia bacterium]|nr:hypothetical protein [Clostridia bacterium]